TRHQAPYQAPTIQRMNAPTPRRAEVRTALTARATDIVCNNLMRYGSTVAGVHRASLDYLLHRMSGLALGIERGRYAFPLACGLGKTQAVVAFGAAIHELELHGLSVAVSATQVEALCELKRDLIGNGVPEEKIGLLHAYKFDQKYAGAITRGELPTGYASLPATADNDQRQFQLVTHQRVEGGRANLDLFANYQGGRRSLLVWDESLMASQPTCI